MFFSSTLKSTRNGTKNVVHLIVMAVSISMQFCFNLIYLGLTSLSTHCISYLTRFSFKGRGTQYILVGKDSAL